MYFFRFYLSSFDSCFRSLMASVQFASLYPFVNPSKISPDGLAISDYKNVMWPDTKENAVCMMLGAVHSCNIIHPTAAGANRIRALTIIPSTPAYHDFQHFLWKKYSTSVLYGPFDYGCLLTFTSRREGLTSSCKFFLFLFFAVIYSFNPSQMVPPSHRPPLKVTSGTWKLLDPQQLHLPLLSGMRRTSLLLLITIKIVCICDII